MKLEDLNIYQMSMVIGNKIWDLVIDWEYFAKDTIGKQVVRSSDSIAANIAESYGRYHYKDAKNFCYYARGSLYETRTWMIKALNRNLISKEFFTEIDSDVEKLAIRLNNYIQSIGKNSGSRTSL